MPRRLLLALILLVAAPLVLLGWVSTSAVRASQESAKKNLSTLLSTQLYDTDRQIVFMFERYAATLTRDIETAPSLIPALRRLRRNHPVVRQGIFVDPKGRILFPSPDDSPDIDAVEVAATLPALVDARPYPNEVQRAYESGNAILVHPGEVSYEDIELESNAAFAGGISNGSDQATSDRLIDEGRYELDQNEDVMQSVLPQEAVPQAAIPQAAVPQQQNPAVVHSPEFIEEQAWQQWFMGDGAQVVFWKFRADGSSVGILFERSRWLADLIALMPDGSKQLPFTPQEANDRSGISSKIAGGRTYAPTPIGGILMLDEAKREVYRWGTKATNNDPVASIQLSEPLRSWQLQLQVDDPLVATSSSLPIYLSIGGVALLLLSLGAYVLTSVRRQIANARSRVSFAGQVSHELRTPLTNIRLYTELAESDLQKVDSSDARDSLSRRLEVIDHESRRLQRLVSGVLEMIRPRGKQMGVRREKTEMCALLDVIVDQFRPSFEVAGLSVEAHCNIERPIQVDPDVVELVLVNLLGNVEKYVPRDGKCDVDCSVDESRGEGVLRILVQDDGPGIRVMHRAKVFRPFERLDDSINAPSGTGIGLTIAQRAAKRHGGDLVLLSDCELGGAAFELTIPLGEEN